MRKRFFGWSLPCKRDRFKYHKSCSRVEESGVDVLKTKGHCIVNFESRKARKAAKTDGKIHRYYL